jgi:hypothetical protein
MSWDIFVQDIPKNARAVSDIPDDFEPRPLGPRSEVIRRILEVVPNADASDPSWVTIEGPDYSIECNIGDDEEVTSFVLHVRGGDVAAGLVSDLLSRSSWRAFDSASESGLFDPASAVDSFGKWRAYRDRILGSNEAG